MNASQYQTWIYTTETTQTVSEISDSVFREDCRTYNDQNDEIGYLFH